MLRHPIALAFGLVSLSTPVFAENNAKTGSTFLLDTMTYCQRLLDMPLADRMARLAGDGFAPDAATLPTYAEFIERIGHWKGLSDDKLETFVNNAVADLAATVTGPATQVYARNDGVVLQLFQEDTHYFKASAAPSQTCRYMSPGYLIPAVTEQAFGAFDPTLDPAFKRVEPDMAYFQGYPAETSDFVSVNVITYFSQRPDSDPAPQFSPVWLLNYAYRPTLMN